MLYLYRGITNNLADLGKQQADITPGSVVIPSAGEWYKDFTF
jgi:hypothetical protein